MLDNRINSYKEGPDENGRFGNFGGRFVSETLMPLILSLEKEYQKAKSDNNFWKEMEFFLKDYVGRPSPLYFSERLTKHFGGAKIYLKRDELNHTGAHKINNVLGQILLAKRMGKKRIIAETGAGHHGVATATVCALFGLPCIVYMGEKDIERQSPNVFRMKLLGAEIRSVSTGSKSLKDAMNEALRDWVTNVKDTFYIIGTAAGPHPYPAMVRDFQSVIGKEVREQLEYVEGKSPDLLMACIGGGSNALGLFHEFLDEPEISKIAVEADETAALSNGTPGIMQGMKTYMLQIDDGAKSLGGMSLGAGITYFSVGPLHSYLRDQRAVTYSSATDQEMLEAYKIIARTEGICSALEPMAAAAEVIFRQVKNKPKDYPTTLNSEEIIECSNKYYF